MTAALQAPPTPQYGRLQFSWTVRLFPILFFELYLMLTVVLFAFGPWPWPIQYPGTLYSFLLLAQIALLLGYLHGIAKRPGGYFWKWKVESIVKVSIAVTVLMAVPLMYVRGGGQVNLLEGLVDPGRVYNESRERVLTLPYAINLIEYLNVIVSPIKWCIVPLTFFYWSKLSTTVRIGCLLAVAGSLLPYVVSGTNKGIFDAVILFPWLFIASKLLPERKRHPRHPLKQRRRSSIVLKASAFSAVLLSLAIIYFSVGQRGRATTEASLEREWQVGINASAENIFVAPLPRSWFVPAIRLMNYLTQGYYGLSVCLQEPFVPMWGVGNSMFYTWIASRIVNEPSMRTLDYPSRAEYRGWDSRGRWASIYPWIASDFSFPGTILVVFFVGQLFALSWLDVLRKNNPFAVVVFSFFIIMLIYFPANNQVLQASDTAFAFPVAVFFWLLTRYRFRTQTPTK